ncbi:hypothetical protein BCR39DRAFT_524211 [Naematelia encephala]|uniref:Uncharacterized protein n=1 Tax=Naematelia encephala TaxID=71784 RepID=A0A1Y2BC59_9TREE|nr:hypothetical protein BCR39DRAFT_524211 [Naematelia encephala]
MSDLIDYCDRTNWRNEKGGKANFNVVMNSALYTSMDKDRARNALKTWDDQLANRSDLQKELNDWSSVMCDSGDALSNQASPAIEQNAMCTPELVNNFLKNCAMFLLDASTNDRDKGWLETIAGEVSTAFSELQLPIKPWTQHLSEAATERVKSATEKSSEHPTEGGSSAPGRQRENNRKKKDKLKRKKEKEKLERQKMAAMIPSETDPERTKGSQSASVRGESTLEGLPMSAGTPINLGNELSEDPSSDHHLLQTRPKTVQSESVASALDQTLQEDSAPRSSEQSGGALEEEKLSIGTDNIPTSAGEDTSIASRIETTKGESFGDQPGETFGVLTLKRDPNNPGTELTSPLTLEQPSASVTTGSYHEATIASEASWRLSLPSDVRFLATYNEHQKYLSEKRDEGTNPDPKAYWNIHDSYFPPVKDHISPRVKSDPWENNGTTQYTHIPEDWEGPPNSEKTGPFTCFRPNFFPYPEKQYVGNVPPEEFESQLNERREMERREFLLRDKGEQRSSWQPQDSLESGDGLSHNDQFSTIGSTGQIIGEVREVAGGTSTGDEPIPDTASSDFKSSSGTKRTSRRDVTAGASTSRDEQSTPEKQSKDARRRADQAAKREKKRTEKAERKSQRRG